MEDEEEDEDNNGDKNKTKVPTPQTTPYTQTTIVLTAEEKDTGQQTAERKLREYPKLLKEKLSLNPGLLARKERWEQ